jgi:hypothetical protein
MASHTELSRGNLLDPRPPKPSLPGWSFVDESESGPCVRSTDQHGSGDCEPWSLAPGPDYKGYAYEKINYKRIGSLLAALSVQHQSGAVHQLTAGPDHGGPLNQAQENLWTPLRRKEVTEPV